MAKPKHIATFAPPSISVNVSTSNSIRVPRSMPTTPRGNKPFPAIPALQTAPSASDNVASTSSSPAPPPAYELLPTHIRHNLQQAKAIAFHVSPRRLLRTHSYNHALRATRRLISSMHALRSGLELYTKHHIVLQQQQQNGIKLNPVHPSLSSLSSTVSSSADSSPTSTNSSNSSNSQAKSTDTAQAKAKAKQTTTPQEAQPQHTSVLNKLPRRVDGLQATGSRFAEGRRKRRVRAAAEAKPDAQTEMDELIRGLQNIEKSLLASRERAQRAMPAISAATDIFVLLSVFLSLPTTPGLNATNGGRTAAPGTVDYSSKNLKLSTSRSKRKQQQQQQQQQQMANNQTFTGSEPYSPQLPRRASAPSLGSRPEGRPGRALGNRRRPPSALHDLVDGSKAKDKDGGWAGFGSGRKRRLAQNSNRDASSVTQAPHLPSAATINHGRVPWRRTAVV